MNKRFNKALIAIVILTSNMVASLAVAQGNPIPSNWRTLYIKVMQTTGNNQTKALVRAKVTLSLKNPGKATAILQKYPVLKLPTTRSSQTTGVRFSKIPPSRDVGTYVVTVDPTAFNSHLVCVDQNRYHNPKNVDRVNMGGSSDIRRTFEYKCRNQ